MKFDNGLVIAVIIIVVVMILSFGFCCFEKAEAQTNFSSSTGFNFSGTPLDVDGVASSGTIDGASDFDLDGKASISGTLDVGVNAYVAGQIGIGTPSRYRPLHIYAAVPGYVFEDSDNDPDEAKWVVNSNNLLWQVLAVNEDVSASNTFIQCARDSGTYTADYTSFPNGDVVMGATTAQVTGLTVLDNIHAGGSITQNSNLRFKENIERDTSRSWLLKSYTLRANSAISKATEIPESPSIIDAYNHSLKRSGIDADDPTVPEELISVDLYGERKLDLGKAVGWLINRVEELEDRVSALEGR